MPWEGLFVPGEGRHKEQKFERAKVPLELSLRGAEGPAVKTPEFIKFPSAFRHE